MRDDIYITYCLSITEDKGQFIKYDGRKNRQFREALLGVYKELSKKGVVRFVTVEDLQLDGSFTNYYTLIGKYGDRLEFERIKEPHTPDIIINRVKDKLYHHPALAAASWKIYNSPEVAKYGNKIDSAFELGEYMPKTLIVKNVKKQQKDILEMLKENDRLVFKPARDNGGRGVRIIDDILDIEKDVTPFILQEFIETSQCVKGLVIGRHDVRIYVIDSHMVMMSIRRPLEGEFLSNTSQGGTINFFSVDRIPKELRKIAESILDKMSDKEYNYFISLDFFYDGDKWLLVEVNDQPGMPAEYQTAEAKDIYKTFARSVLGMTNDN